MLSTGRFGSIQVSMEQKCDGVIGEPAPPASGRRLLARLRFALLSLVAFVGTFAVGLLVRHRMPATLAVSVAGMVLVAAVLLLIGLTLLLRHAQLWRHPVDSLEKLTRRIHSGEEPIESLRQFTGPLAPLADAIGEILRDARMREHEIARIELEMTQRVAQRTAALEHRYNSLQNQATRDSLTGLLNRRWYDQQFPQVVEQAVSRRDDLTLLMLDLDNFKFLNDTRGHAAGDEFLRDVGQIIRSTVRPADLCFRCGGDEFVVALLNTTPQGGESVRRRLEMLLDALGRNTRLAYPPGCSTGMASLSELSRPMIGELVALADRRLYDAKARRKSPTAPRSPAPLRKTA